jgi:hypothetical protein
MCGRQALNYAVRTAKNRNTLSERHSLVRRRSGATERRERKRGKEEEKEGEGGGREKEREKKSNASGVTS